jgi:hypothetical protein
MSCPACASEKQVGFSAEMMLHFTGLKNLDKPGVLLFTRFLICMDCGFARVTVPEAELALLAQATSTCSPGPGCNEAAGVKSFGQSASAISA